jgi:hypothetical protein
MDAAWVEWVRLWGVGGNPVGSREYGGDRGIVVDWGR